jgi:hypothetical protein
MILRTDHPQFYYDLFYQLSSLIVILIFLVEGSRRNLPWISLLLIAVTSRIFLIAGSKLAGINADDLHFFAQHFSFPPEHSKNMAGALLFGLIGLGLSKLILRIKYPILDVFAIATPFGMAIQRIGCLITGCCFGIETSSPLGIQYGTNSPAFFHEFTSGRVNFANQLSLHIHPVPLYFIISSLLIGIVLLRFRNYWKRPGNLALSGMVILLLSWFMIEFFRDPLSNGTFLGGLFGGLKRIQMIYLGLIPLLILIIFIREKKSVQTIVEIQENHPVHNSLYLLMLLALIFITRNWYSPTEFSTLLFVLIPASFGVVVQIIRHYYTPQVRVTVAFLTLLSFILMSQTLPENEKKTYQSVKIGYSGGNFETYHNIGIGEGCDRMSQSQSFYQKYKMMGIGYSMTQEQNKKILEYGLNGYFGSHDELAQTTKIKTTDIIFGINPFIKYDMKWFGIGGGLHLGNIQFSPADWTEEAQEKLPTTGTRKSPVLPQGYFRFGPKHIAFISYKFADQFPSPFPGMYQNLELGSGFGQKNGFNLRFGTFFNGSYLTATIPIRNKVVIEPLYEWFSASSPNPNQYQFSIGLHYRFGHKTQMVAAK